MSGAALRIVGIDPGTLVVGLGVLDVRGGDARYVACEALRAPRDRPPAERLRCLHDELAARLAEHRPDAVALERVFVGKNVASALRIGEARGVALVCAARVGAPVFEYPPAAVKRAIAGFGAADKAQMAAWIGRLLGLPRPPEPHDAADALSLALTHAHRSRTLPGEEPAAPPLR